MECRGDFAQVYMVYAQSQVKCTYSPCSTPVILNCLTLWEHSNLGLFETQEPLRYLKHSFVLRPRQTASSSPGFRGEDVLLHTPVHTVNAQGGGRGRNQCRQESLAALNVLSH